LFVNTPVNICAEFTDDGQERFICDVEKIILGGTDITLVKVWSERASISSQLDGFGDAVQVSVCLEPLWLGGVPQSTIPVIIFLIFSLFVAFRWGKRPIIDFLDGNKKRK